MNIKTLRRYNAQLKRTSAWLVFPLILGTGMSCGSEPEEDDGPHLPDSTRQYYTGRIYDGVTLARLPKYKLRLEYYDRVIQANVDSTGRYVVGPLLPNADFSIVIEADGYRSFQSHNPRIAVTSEPNLTSLHYEAFLYPTATVAPAVQATFVLSDSPDRPSGTVRFEPRSSSSLFDDAVETPAGVERQIWNNDDDLQQGTIVRKFSNGELTLEEGALVLGVQYAVSVFGVEKYAMIDNQTFRAGADTNPTFELQPLAEPMVQVVSTSEDDPTPSADGSVEIRFSHEVALYPRVSESTMVRELNDSFRIDSPDEDADRKTNVLVTTAQATMAGGGSIASDYRGVTYTLDGDRLTLHWDRERGLGAVDTGDPVLGVRYGGLSAIKLYTATVPGSPVVSLADLLGKDALDVQIQPE